MSEESEKVLGIKHLPIFPLPLILLPHELLPLHIFEERYRKMLQDVALEKNMFGVTLFEPPDEFVDKPATGTIGCVAEIRESQTLEDGRSNILTVGVIRYHLIEYVDAGEPYLVGDVEFFEDEPEDEAVLNPLADEVFELFKRVAKAAHKLSGQQGDFPEIPQAPPEQLSFLVSAAFNLDHELKYNMLELRKTSERLERLKDILSQAVTQVEQSAQINKISRTNGHANKKIDIDL
jgi:Lon protease-like protein